MSKNDVGIKLGSHFQGYKYMTNTKWQVNGKET